ncbi:MAG TPA: TIGR02757 family protein [Candidatus Krumholzibacterium sp.]|nr:TIGR02757 family protein [Candidatus Krumholzibacterium sp.]
MDGVHLKRALDDLYDRYNHRRFVDPDPLVFLYGYEDVRDREVAALIASSLAFGGVKQIMSSVEKVLGVMGGSPASFLLGQDGRDIERTFSGFRHRWATGCELSGMMSGIKWIMENHGSVEAAFVSGMDESDEDTFAGLTHLAGILYERSPERIDCLIPAPGRGSACKRLHLFLKWMVRKDRVDPGGWTGVPASKLLIPLDVHMHRFARSMGLTSRAQGDMKTVREVTARLREFAPEDPVRYDFSLTRLGIRRDRDREMQLSRLGIVLSGDGRAKMSAGPGHGRAGKVEG